MNINITPCSASGETACALVWAGAGARRDLRRSLKHTASLALASLASGAIPPRVCVHPGDQRSPPSESPHSRHRAELTAVTYTQGFGRRSRRPVVPPHVRPSVAVCKMRRPATRWARLWLRSACTCFCFHSRRTRVSGCARDSGVQNNKGGGGCCCCCCDYWRQALAP